MARRTAIVVSTSIRQHTTRVAADANREANWRAKGLAPFAITDEELANIQGLRDATIEFAALTSRNNYIPLAYKVDDLLRFYVARRPAVLEQDNLHVGILAVLRQFCGHGEWSPYYESQYAQEYTSVKSLPKDNLQICPFESKGLQPKAGWKP